MFPFSYSPADIPIWTLVLSFHPPSPLRMIPHQLLCLYHVAVITLVFLVLFSHVHPDKKEVALHIVRCRVNDGPLVNGTRPCRMGDKQLHSTQPYRSTKRGGLPVEVAPS